MTGLAGVPALAPESLCPLCWVRQEGDGLPRQGGRRGSTRPAPLHPDRWVDLWLRDGTRVSLAGVHVGGTSDLRQNKMNVQELRCPGWVLEGDRKLMGATCWLVQGRRGSCGAQRGIQPQQGAPSMGSWPSLSKRGESR